MTFEEEISRMKALRASIPAKMAEISHDATIEAVRVATEKTPPVTGDLRGTNTRTGMLKDSWDSSSITTPEVSGNVYETQLRNSMEYASYVNDGHRMDRHFVPGLYVDPYSGLLEYDPTLDVGIMVGTKTQYVEGLFMAEAGEDAFNDYVEKAFAKLTEELK